MTKILKPGQLCTIYGKQRNPLKRTVENHIKHVYRCKKAMTYHTCLECEITNKTICCLLLHNNVSSASQTCYKLFGLENYPVLVK